MVNAVLFWRSDSTLTTSVSSLVSADSSKSIQTQQCLEYDAPDNILEAVQETYGNRINEQVSVNSEGNRQIFIRDDGLATRSLAIQGIIKKESTDITKLKHFRILQQTTTNLVHGRFGIRIGNATHYQIDPRKDNYDGSGAIGRGLMIKDMTIGYSGAEKTRYAFKITLAFGGQHIADESGNI